MVSVAIDWEKYAIRTAYWISLGLFNSLTALVEMESHVQEYFKLPTDCARSLSTRAQPHRSEKCCFFCLYRATFSGQSRKIVDQDWGIGNTFQSTAVPRTREKKVNEKTRRRWRNSRGALICMQRANRQTPNYANEMTVSRRQRWNASWRSGSWI